MKEIVARSLLAVVGFLVLYLLMAFTVGTLDITEWTLDQRGTVAVVEAMLVLMISTFPIKLTK